MSLHSLPVPLSLALLGLGLLLGIGGGLWLGRLPLRRQITQLRRSLAATESANAGLQDVLESLEQAAGTDRLTGAWNRRRFEEAVQAEMALARRRRTSVALLMLDLDHFKQVNDRFGHEAGDTVLVAAAQRWKGLLRASDSLSRWGGEEFLVLSPTTGRDGAAILGDKLREALRAIEFPGVGAVTVSIGAAEYVPGETLEALVQRADQALYQAKAEGRDRVVVAENPAAEPQDLRPILELQWEEAWLSGHRVIDAQHRRLFELANALLAALTMGLPREEAALRWTRLLAHTAQHFSDEERILARSGFAELAHHAGEHQRILALARELHASFTAGALDLGRLLNFLAVDLVKGHLMEEDCTYFKDLDLDYDPQQPG